MRPVVSMLGYLPGCHREATVGFAYHLETKVHGNRAVGFAVLRSNGCREERNSGRVEPFLELTGAGIVQPGNRDPGHRHHCYSPGEPVHRTVTDCCTIRSSSASTTARAKPEGEVPGAYRTGG